MSKLITNKLQKEFMKTFYKKKADFHHEQWNAAVDSGRTKAASYHMIEYLNYAEMLKMAERNNIN